MEPEIIVIDKVEEAQDDKGKLYLKVTDKAGITRSIKEGRSNLLTNKGHLLKEGVAVELHFQDYKTPDGKVFPFVQDFKLVENALVEKAAQKQGKSPAPQEVGRNRSLADERSRSFALSYSKDLVVAGKIEVDKVLSYAEVFVRWLDGEIKVTDEDVFKSLLKKTFNVDEEEKPE